ncbi:hypothetical protein GYA13_01855 [Candidatus Kuenenbacteria bacterium]|nr:hypothetical protein [Candidatus Kuenenbacteria bacterium]
MGLKTFSIDFAELKSKESLRLWIPFVLPESKYKYDKINNFLSTCEAGNRPKGGIKDEDEGEAISLGGEQIGKGGSLELSKIPYVSFDFYESATKGKVQNNDILICKDGALTGKACWVDFSLFPSNKVMVNEHVYILRGNSEVNQQFLFYYTTTNLFQSQVKDLAYKKKAQPGLNADHFKKIKIPLIPKPNQDQIVAQIEPIEKKIKELKSQLKDPQEIINKVFAREFGFDLKKFEESKKVKFFEVEFSIISQTNDLKSNVSTSLNNKVNFQIPNVKYFKIKNIAKNIFAGGDMPKDFSEEKDETYKYPIFSNGKENLGFIAYCKKARVNDKATTISARGTIGFAVAREESYFPIVRLISVIPNEELILNEYLASIINFQSIEKTGNTIAQLTTPMVENIKIPVPELDKQRKIVDEIKAELDKQEEIKSKIESERNNIDEIIEKAIK